MSTRRPTNGIVALTGDYSTEEEALAAIRETLIEEYPEGGPAVEQAILTIERIYRQNFFPAMKVSWEAFPDHIGHMISPGCFRCHDNEHESEAGEVISHDCDSCHTIIAQGPGLKLASVTSEGLPFKHPEDIGDEWKESRCDECHTGVPVL